MSVFENNHGPGLSNCLAGGCQSNCCAFYPKIKSTHLSVFGVPNGEIPVTSAEVNQLISEGKSELAIQLQDGFWYLKVDSNGRCPFLAEGGSCTRHLNRFASCRSYPYFIEKYAGLVVDVSCPGVKDGIFDKESSKEQISALIELMQARLDHLAVVFDLPSKKD